jgi:prepilin-type N-terminal cleavage/methylation domain-containing protein
MKKLYSTVRGFTLIELLVVIAIIALLTGIILTSLTSSKAKSRDAERVSDISQLQLALELYFDRCHVYPVAVNNNVKDSLTNGSCTDQQGITVNFSDYIGKIPVPPAGANPDQSTSGYGYYVNSIDDTKVTDYILYASLEGVSTASANSLIQAQVPNDITGPTCDTSMNYCVGPK